MKPDGVTITADAAGVISVAKDALDGTTWAINVTPDVSADAEHLMLFMDGDGRLWDKFAISSANSRIRYSESHISLLSDAYSGGSWTGQRYRIIRILKVSSASGLDTWLAANATEIYPS